MSRTQELTGVCVSVAPSPARTRIDYPKWMGDVEEPFRAEYEVVFDPAANMRINKAHARTLLGAWFHYGFRWGVILATLFLILTYVVLVWANRAEPAYILMAASFSGIAIGILGSLWMLRTQVANCNANVDKGWHCVFSDEAWSYSDPEGASVSIPWSIMKLEGAQRCLSDPLWPGEDRCFCVPQTASGRGARGSLSQSNREKALAISTLRKRLSLLSCRT